MSAAPDSYWPRGLPRTLRYAQAGLWHNIEVAAARYPDKPAIVFYDRVYSYSELRRQAEALAAWLEQRCGVGNGDRVLLYSQNCPQFVIAYYATLRAGAVVVPVNAMSTERELRYLVADSGATVAIAAGELYATLQPLLADASLSAAVVLDYADALAAETDLPVPDWLRQTAPALGAKASSWRAVLAAALQPVLASSTIAADDLVVLPYTSGTTGHPKGCVHTHATLTAAIRGSQLWRGLTSEAVFLAVAPLFHLLGMQNGMNLPLSVGGTIVMLPRWDRQAAAQLIARYGVTTWAAPPAMLVDFFSQPQLERYDLSSLALLSGGGAAMPEAVAQMLEQRFNIVYNEAYGLTETASFMLGNPLARPKKLCLGVATFGVDARIIDPATLQELPTGEVGEIIASGPQVIGAYWNNPEANRELFIEREGKRFLRTGDLGYVDAEGYFFMRDRLKRMINASGYKVWPAEVENVLYGHPDVHEACVIATPDGKRGESVKAVIALKPERRGRVEAETLIAWARTQMAAYKVPRVIEFVDALPKSGTGKIMWRQLQEAEKGSDHGQ